MVRLELASYPKVVVFEAQSATDGGALHCRDDGQRRLEQSDRFGVQVARTTAGAALAAEVGAGAEVLALGAEHDRASRAVTGEVFIEVGDPPDHRQVEEVVGWAAELHRGDPVVDRGAHTVLLVQHQPTLPSDVVSSLCR